jgi:hypothetical protein
LVFVCFAVLPKAQAVLPAPDGGYAGGNTAEGQSALFSLTSGGYNTALGYFSLRSITTGSYNTGLGAGALVVNTSDQNTAAGAGALLSNTTGYQNTANGAFALFINTTGNYNTASGDGALYTNTTGSFNTAIGDNALVSNSAGNSNTAVGYGAGINVGGTVSNVIAIGHPGGGVSGSCFIGNIRGVQTTYVDAIPVLIDSVGQLGTLSSSRRFKKEIKPMEQVSEAILALKPVTFHYKSDNTNRPEFGLIAEEVAAVNPDLVVRDADGKIYTVRYDAVNAMLLNEFLKEHRKVERQDRKLQEQEATIAELKSGMKTLAETVNEQTSQLQKVSAQLATIKPAQTAARIVAKVPSKSHTN